jgi:hypothetical protein
MDYECDIALFFCSAAGKFIANDLQTLEFPNLICKFYNVPRRIPNFILHLVDNRDGRDVSVLRILEASWNT